MSGEGRASASCTLAISSLRSRAEAGARSPAKAALPALRPLLAAALLLSALLPVEAQGLNPAAGLVRAVLVRAEPRAAGLPFLKPNATPAWYGEYRVAQAASGSALLIRVWFVRTPVWLDGDWLAGGCGANPIPLARMRELAGGGGRSIAVVEYADRRLFVDAPAAWADRCRFIAALAERADYFLRYAADAAAFSLPALVELPQAR